MCYKSPGPRCSYHAKKKLNSSTKAMNETGISKGMEVYAQLKQVVDNDELEYYSTPAGMSELELSIEREEDYDGTIAAKLDYCRANRKAMLAAIKTQDAGDTGNHPDFKIPKLGDTGFLKDNKPRKAWKDKSFFGTKIDNSYELNADHVAKGLNAKEMAALQWYSGDGFIHINSRLHQDNGTYVDNMHPMERKGMRQYKEEKVNEAIQHIDAVFEKNRLNEAIVTYRGLNDHNFPKEVTSYKDGESVEEHYEKYINHIQENYKAGTTHSFPGYLSTSLDPSQAKGFAGSKVIMEIKTRSAIPTGFISAWNSEKEVLVQRDRKFKVLGVKRNIAYDASNGKNANKVTIIQLEEVNE